MKRTLVFIVLICSLGISAYAVTDAERYRNWLIDSYDFGKAGNDCSSIYYNYGTPNWTFNSNDPDLLKIFHDACKTGKTDKSTSGNNLSRILDEWDKNK